MNERNNDRDDSARAEEERGRMNQTQDWSQLKERLPDWSRFRGDSHRNKEKGGRDVREKEGKKKKELEKVCWRGRRPSMCS